MDSNVRIFERRTTPEPVVVEFGAASWGTVMARVTLPAGLPCRRIGGANVDRYEVESDCPEPIYAAEDSLPWTKFGGRARHAIERASVELLRWLLAQDAAGRVRLTREASERFGSLREMVLFFRRDRATLAEQLA